MHRIVIVSLILAVACPGWAGGNPGLRAYIDFDPPNYVHELPSPTPFTIIRAYVCLDQVTEGATTLSFRMEDPAAAFPGVIGTAAFLRMWPSSIITTPPPWEGAGTTIPSDECVTGDVLVACAIDVFYLGGSCCLEILDHGDYPRWVTDCSDPLGVDQYCVLAHGSIGGAACPSGDCMPVPVYSETWGMIKSLYR